LNTGQRISLIGHVGLIGWLLFGGSWNSDPLPFEVADVSVVSEAEYQAAVAAARAPQAVSDVEAPQPPAEEETVQPQAAPETQPEVQDAPEVASPEADPTPVVDTSEPEVAQVEDVPPELVQPQEEVAVLVPGASPRPQLRPSERVAPEPVAQPEQTDVQPAEEATPEVVPDTAAEVVQPETEAAAPEEATTEINPEAADDVTLAPAQSMRPRGRPQRQAETATAPASDTSSAVNDALAEAMSGSADTAEETPAPSGPTGPPLTSGEREGLKLAISRCYNVGALSSEALGVNIYVSVEMTRDGKPVINSIKLLRSENGSEAAAKQAYEAARRAIIICGNDGFQLPAEKYDQWKTVEIKFNPESMR
jgi:hypothetical protein